MAKLIFQVPPYSRYYSKHDGSNSVAFLEANNWDDFGFKSLFHLVVYDENGAKHDIGGIKIGCQGHQSGWIQERLDEEFSFLNKSFFSLGQSDEYYQNLYLLSEDLRVSILESLNDVVHSEAIYNLAINEKVMKESLLRDVSIASIKGQFRRLLGGGKPRTEFDFSFSLAQDEKTAGLNMDFYVDPESNPPSNIHVLIGRNGVGKTHLLHNMLKTLIDTELTEGLIGVFSVVKNGKKESSKFEDLQEMFAGVRNLST